MSRYPSWLKSPAAATETPEKSLVAAPSILKPLMPLIVERSIVAGYCAIGISLPVVFVGAKLRGVLRRGLVQVARGLVWRANVARRREKALMLARVTR